MSKIPLKYKPLLTQVATAAFTTLLLYYALVFVHLGTIWLFNTGILVELLITFFFLLSIFISNRFISKTFTSGYFSRFSGFWKAVLEGITVVTSSVTLCFLLYYVPYRLIYYAADAPLTLLPERVRLAYVISSVFALFFYYFVERARSLKQLQQEHLRA